VGVGRSRLQARIVHLAAHGKVVEVLVAATGQPRVESMKQAPSRLAFEG